ncbi:TetR/AcrR family transcriptional regulator [Streptomyces sp. NPDC048282]|uniref:TetR/AcrR family transcriptional regulator n=1 Tax=Streptomyces sp. NPDC048282 TaxID=3365528 RepID=UPI0037164D67
MIATFPSSGFIALSFLYFLLFFLFEACVPRASTILVLGHIIGVMRPGRPVTVDRSAVREHALRLFEERGFEQTTIGDITTAAGISRQTLFRLFPSKADLVWDELDVGLMAAFVAAERDPEPRTLREIVHQVFRTPVELEDPEQVESARRRLRLVGTSPSLLRHHTHETLQERMTLAVGRATDLTAPAELVARALVALGLAAMVWWADHETADSAAEILDLTLLSLAKAAPVESGCRDDQDPQVP